MKLSKNAKERWFYNNIVSYEIFWRGDTQNLYYVTYDGLKQPDWLGFHKETSDALNGEIALFLKEIYFLQPAEIFFKYRRFARRKRDEYNMFVMKYTKYAKEVR